MRTILFFNANNEWEVVLPENIKDGMKIMIYEPDGTKVLFNDKKCDYFLVVGDAYLYDDVNYGKIWTWQIKVEE